MSLTSSAVLGPGLRLLSVWRREERDERHCFLVPGSVPGEGVSGPGDLRTASSGLEMPRTKLRPQMSAARTSGRRLGLHPVRQCLLRELKRARNTQFTPQIKPETFPHQQPPRGDRQPTEHVEDLHRPAATQTSLCTDHFGFPHHVTRLELRHRI